MIYVTGDIHGLRDVLKFKSEEFRKNINKKGNYVIITGDSGITWNEDTMKRCIKFYSKFNCTILFIDGNNDNFDILDKLPVSKYCGGKVHKICDNIYHLMRGEIFDLEGISFLAFGGADSWDSPIFCPWTTRVRGESWWARECPSEEEFKNALKNLKLRNNKVDVILTHEGTSECAEFFGSCTRTVCNMLDYIDNVAKYNLWYFGHHHHDINVTKDKKCMFNTFENVNKMLKRIETNNLEEKEM